MKRYIVFIFLLVLVISGCGKKKDSKSTDNDNKPTYTVKFDAGEGSLSSSETESVKEGSQISKTVPTRVGYSFDGWYVGDKKWSIESDTVTSDVTLKAHWVINQYTLTLKYNDGITNDLVITQDYNSTIQVINNPTRIGYTFNKWSEEIPMVMPAENKVISASWTINQYTLTLKYNDGVTNDLVITQDYNSTIRVINNPIRIGYTFDKWGEGLPLTMPAEDLTINAVWICDVKYKIENNCAIITGYNNLEEITLLDSYEGYPVTRIDEYAFKDCNCLKRLGLPSYVSSIGKGAFSGCSNLISLVLPFIGASLDGTSNTHFGYIFGASSPDQNSSVVPASLKSVGILWGDRVENDAFSGCSNLDSIELHNGVTHIGDNAFKNCTNLVSMEIPSSLTCIGKGAFSGCGKLISITIPFVGASLNGADNTYFGYIFGGSLYEDNPTVVPASLKTVKITGGGTISSFAFYNCTNLTCIKIINNVTLISSNAFYECTNLQTIEIPNSVTTIWTSAFYGCDKLQYNTYDNAYYLGNNDNPYLVLAHTIDTSITSCTISEFTKIICYDAFLDCTKLSNIEIPNSVTYIGDGAFSNCTSLTSIEIPNSVTCIEKNTFSGCTQLENIEIPNSIISIGVNAFRYCDNLNYTVYKNGCYLGNKDNHYMVLAKVTDQSITSFNFNKATKIIMYSAFRNCTELISVDIPSGVTNIGGYAFSKCSNLESVKIPNTVTRIETSAFQGCACLGDINFPNSITYIGSYAFYGCKVLKTIQIPNSVTTIENYAFLDCTDLEKVYIPNSVTSIGSCAFMNCKYLVIYCEVESKPVGWSSNWYYITPDCIDITVEWNYKK